MARRPELEIFAKEHGLKIGSIEQLIQYRLATEHTVDEIDARDIETPYGAFKLHTFKDRLNQSLHYALTHGEIKPDQPTLVRVQVQNILSDSLHWSRNDFGNAIPDVLRKLREADASVMVLLSDDCTNDEMLARITQQPSEASTLREWRQTGVGSQILSALGAGQIRVIGTPRKQIGAGGFGLQILEYV